jgi:zinc protease
VKRAARFRQGLLAHTCMCTREGALLDGRDQAVSSDAEIAVCCVLQQKISGKGAPLFHSTRRRLVSMATLAIMLAPQVHAAAQGVTSKDPLAGIPLDVPATRMKLSNGLTLIVHEDHSAPLVAVSVWYHVGSKDEPKGKDGFAHLFEHLMFNGSENYNDDFFKATRLIGATEQNGTTNTDRTNYFETVPKNALDTMLWLESDRMGHLLGAIDKGRVDEQRAVVENEKRQGQNRPYSKTQDLIVRATQPVGHPYDHTTIGSIEDLDAASVDDVKSWFRSYYGPSNAVLVLSGDITPAEARSKVEHYFGDIPPGEPVVHPGAWVAKMSGTKRETAFDRVAQPRLTMVWNIPGYGSQPMTDLDLLGDLLVSGHTGRLYDRLVTKDQLATKVSAGTDGQEIEGQFEIDVMLKPGGDPARVEAIVDEELRRLIDKGATPDEMARVRVQYEANLARAFESIASKAAVLAQSQTFLGDPDAWKNDLARRRTATSADVQRTAKAWLSDGDYVLAMLPFGDLKAASIGADRKTMPMPSTVAAATFPPVERATLSNGLKLVVARRSGSPLLNIAMMTDTGIPADYASWPAGTSTLAMSLLDEGTVSMTGAEIADRLSALGVELDTGGDAETGQVTMSLLKPVLAQAMPVFADVIMHPAYREADVARVKAEREAQIRSSRQTPVQIAARVAPRLVYGAGYPYGRVTTENSIQSIDRKDLVAFHERWFHPNNATLIVTGDTSLAEIRPTIETAFASWRPAFIPATIAPRPTAPEKSVVYLIDTPGSPQSVIDAVFVAPPRREGDEMPRKLFNTAFGGGFVSRVNMKLREEKGWSYGARSSFSDGRAARLFVAGGPVQSDKTADALHELDLLLKGVVGDKPIDAKELAEAKTASSLSLSGAWSTGDGIAAYLGVETSDKLPDNYFDQYALKIDAGTLAATNKAAALLVAGHPATWIVVGDRDKIESKVRALNLGEMVIVDADGKPST